MNVLSIFPKGLKLEGDVRAGGDFRVDGEIVGALEIQGRLVVSEGARVIGNIRAESVIVRGTVQGDVEGRESIRVESTAVVQGDVKAERVAVALGARVRGQVRMAGPVPNQQEKHRAAVGTLSSPGVWATPAGDRWTRPGTLLASPVSSSVAKEASNKRLASNGWPSNDLTANDSIGNDFVANDFTASESIADPTREDASERSATVPGIVSAMIPVSAVVPSKPASAESKETLVGREIPPSFVSVAAPTTAREAPPKVEMRSEPPARSIAFRMPKLGTREIQSVSATPQIAKPFPKRTRTRNFEGSGQ